MRRFLPLALLLLSNPLHADCNAKSPPSQYSAAITAPPCNAAAPCVQHTPIHFSLIGSCSVPPLYPGGCAPPYVIDSCDTLTWNFGDGTPTQTVYGSGAVDHVFPVAGNFIVNVDVTNGAGTGRIHGSAYVCADPPAYVRFSQPEYTVSEHGGTVAVTLERSGNTARAFTLQYSTFPNGADFVRNLEPLMMNVDFAAGETTKQVVHRVQDDAVFTGDSDHSVGVTSDGAAVMDVGPVTTSNIRVVEDEPGPELTIDDVTVPEGNGPHPVTFVLHLSKPASDRVYAWCVPHDGSARSGVDFLLRGSSAIIEPGATSGTCQVQVLGNTVVESDKTFTVSTDPVLGPVTVKKGTASCTLTNDDVLVPVPPAPVPPTPVPPAPVTPVPVTPALWFPNATMTMSVGATERATLSATDSMDVSLVSSDPSVVRVDPAAGAPSAIQLTAVGFGHATITATNGQLTAQLVVDVALNPRRRSARH